jgi:hypothetical protein
MFPFSNPEIQLDLYHHRAAELYRSADAYRLARSVRSAGRHTRRGRNAGSAHGQQAVRAPVTP